eukprot:6142294-Prymnesium_polylepis.1
MAGWRTIAWCGFPCSGAGAGGVELFSSELWEFAGQGRVIIQSGEVVPNPGHCPTAERPHVSHKPAGLA